MQLNVPINPRLTALRGQARAFYRSVYGFAISVRGKAS